MRCPFCGEDNDRVVNSRSNADATCVKRRRECRECGRRFTTYERIERVTLRVVKKGGDREEFSREKVLEGMLTACHKRPVPTGVLEEAADRVERKLHQEYELEVPVELIGEMVMEELKGIDEVAYVRFASVYREFKDVSDFMHEADTVLRGGGSGAEERQTEAKEEAGSGASLSSDTVE